MIIIDLIYQNHGEPTLLGMDSYNGTEYGLRYDLLLSRHKMDGMYYEGYK